MRLRSRWPDIVFTSNGTEVSVVLTLLAFMLGLAGFYVDHCVYLTHFTFLGPGLMQSRVLGRFWKSFPTLLSSSHFLALMGSAMLSDKGRVLEAQGGGWGGVDTGPRSPGSRAPRKAEASWARASVGLSRPGGHSWCFVPPFLHCLSVCLLN